ncbi:hypothetical protein LZ31DRAFT_320897 [Colletotrichum somersetense]|nr:hypothetical protein LZ31DRAFT_320897 [Colletotrichum somersetense]
MSMSVTPASVCRSPCPLVPLLPSPVSSSKQAGTHQCDQPTYLTGTCLRIIPTTIVPSTQSPHPPALPAGIPPSQHTLITSYIQLVQPTPSIHPPPPLSVSLSHSAHTSST